MRSVTDPAVIRDLLNAPIPPRSAHTPLGQGITASGTVLLGSTRAVVKFDGRPGDANREAAAYALSTVFPGLVDVPYTTVRESDAADGAVRVAVQQYRPDTHRVQSWASILRSDILGAATFDYIIDNPDRHPGNFLAVDGSRTVLCIDHGFAFSGMWTASEFLRRVRGQALPAYIRSHLQDRLLARVPFVRSTLAPYLTDAAIARVFDRADALLVAGRFPRA